MARIPEDILQAVRDRVDLVDLIGRHIALKKAGRNFVGLCPFHQEKTPSFNVNVDRQIFHCFGCGEGGNAFTFLVKHENLTFPEAVRTLAREVGVEVPENQAPGERGLAERLHAANGVAQELYRSALGSPQAKAAGDYLARRGLGPEEIEHFGIGFAPPGGQALVRQLEREQVPVAVGVKAGLLAERDRGGHYDRLRDRVIFPIQDARGRVLGFGGRALGEDQQPKYLNTPESPIYRKREVFYGLHLALAAMRRQERAVVVEGYFDRIAMHRAGIEEAVATCGTALTAEHARALRRRTQTVVLVFDGDEAGQRAVAAALEVLLPEGLRAKAVLLPSGDDPDSLLEREGADSLRARVDAAEPAVDLVIRRALAQGCTTPWEKADVVSEVAPLVSLVPDAVERAELVRRLALAVDTDAAAVAAAVRASRRGSDQEVREVLETPVRRDDRRVRWAEHLLAALLVDVDLLNREGGEALQRLVPESMSRAALDLVLSEVATSGGIDVAAIPEEGADAVALALLRRLALEDRFAGDPEVAARAFHDVVKALRKAAEREQGRERTRRFDPGSTDHSDFIAAKQRELEQRRAKARGSMSESEARV